MTSFELIWKYFLGIDHEPAPGEIEKIFNGFDRVIVDGPATGCMQYLPHGVAFLHLCVIRGRPGDAMRTLFRCIGQAKEDGIRKVVCPISSGNPTLRVGPKHRLGFELEGVLKQQTKVDGDYRDLYLYSKFI